MSLNPVIPYLVEFFGAVTTQVEFVQWEDIVELYSDIWRREVCPIALFTEAISPDGNSTPEGRSIVIVQHARVVYREKTFHWAAGEEP